MDELVVGNRQLDNPAGNLRCHGDDIGAHSPVAGPRRPHIGDPHRAAEHTGNEARDGSDNKRHGSPPSLLRGTFATMRESSWLDSARLLTIAGHAVLFTRDL